MYRTIQIEKAIRKHPEIAYKFFKDMGRADLFTDSGELREDIVWDNTVSLECLEELAGKLPCWQLLNKEHEIVDIYLTKYKLEDPDLTFVWVEM